MGAREGRREGGRGRGGGRGGERRDPNPDGGRWELQVRRVVLGRWVGGRRWVGGAYEGGRACMASQGAVRCGAVRTAFL